MDDQLTIYVVTEYRRDYDDYPVGAGRIIKSFTDPLQAKIFAYDHCPSKNVRRITEVEVDMTNAPYDDWMDYLTDKAR